MLTPGEDERACEEEEISKSIAAGDVSGFRAVAARANYLAMDRVDIQYATKKICGGMSQPTVGHN